MAASAPMPLRKAAKPFSGPNWLFELKYDGFRTLAFIDFGRCRLVSRNGNEFASFTALAARIGRLFPQRSAILDGEIVSLDREGRPQFADLLFRRSEPSFVAFDVLSELGKDLRFEMLIDRKMALRRFFSHVRKDSGLIFADHIEEHGEALFQRVCELDLEGIVAKRKTGLYLSNREETTWIKVLNPNYSQRVGRDELFERERHSEPVPGWHTCDLACAEV
jgi:bifunctional non-homologous end joining protein LigD